MDRPLLPASIPSLSLANCSVGSGALVLIGRLAVGVGGALLLLLYPALLVVLSLALLAWLVPTLFVLNRLDTEGWIQKV